MEPMSPQQKSLLEQLRQTNQARLRIPASQFKPISRPDKYANPIGIRGESELFPEQPPPPAANA
jgi:hypothetical protein